MQKKTKRKPTLKCILVIFRPFPTLQLLWVCPLWFLALHLILLLRPLKSCTVIWHSLNAHYLLHNVLKFANNLLWYSSIVDFYVLWGSQQNWSCKIHAWFPHTIIHCHFSYQDSVIQIRVIPLECNHVSSCIVNIIHVCYCVTMTSPAYIHVCACPERRALLIFMNISGCGTVIVCLSRAENGWGRARTSSDTRLVCTVLICTLNCHIIIRETAAACLGLRLLYTPSGPPLRISPCRAGPLIMEYPHDCRIYFSLSQIWKMTSSWALADRVVQKGA